MNTFLEGRTEAGPPPIVITGVRGYHGRTGKIVGATQMLPPWYIVDLDGGGRVVVRPGHCEPRPALRCAFCDQPTTSGHYCERCYFLLACALRGVQLLHEYAAGWQGWPGLNLETLDMEWHGFCLLSQLFGSYEEGIERLDLGPLLTLGPVNLDSYGWEHGFTIPPSTPQDQEKADFARLTAIWKQIILESRQATETPL